MKPTLTIIAISAFAVTTLSGCFSAVARSGEGWNGEKTPTGTKIASGAADVATIPLQAPFLLLAGAGEVGRKREIEQRNQKIEEIRKDPEIIFRKNMLKGAPYSIREAVYYSLWDHSIPFTDDQLRRIYNMGCVYAISNPHCSLIFLKEVMDSIKTKDNFLRLNVVEQLSRNPATPNEWLETISTSPEYHNLEHSYAKSFLENRKMANQAIEPTTMAVTAPAAQEPRHP